jgi:hypothetical protein
MKVHIPIRPGDIFLLEPRFLEVFDRIATDLKSDFPAAVAHFYVFVDIARETVFSVPISRKEVAEAFATCGDDLGLVGGISWFRSKNQFQDSEWARMDHLIIVYETTNSDEVRTRLRAICKSVVPEQMAMLFPRLRFAVVNG